MHQKRFHAMLLVTALIVCSMAYTLPALAEGEPIVLRVMARVEESNNPDYANTMFWQNVEEATGVKIEWITATGTEFDQKETLMYASGDYPDVILMGTSVADEENYGVLQHILLPLEDYITPEIMPTYYELYTSRPNFANQMTASDGHIYSLANCWEIGYTTQGHFFINKTWLDNLGLEIPKTMDEFTAVLEAFRDMDADGDGDASNEIPFELTYTNDATSVGNIFGLFGQLDVGNHLVLENDKVVFSPAQDGFRAGLEWLHEAYAADLIDPEAFSHDLSTYYAKVKAGNVGCFIGWRLLTMAHSYEGMEDDYVVMAPPAVDGIFPQWQRTLASAGIGAAALTIANDHVEETMAWLDYLYQPMVAMQGRSGILGVHAEIDEETGVFRLIDKEDGTPFTNEEINNQVPGPNALFFLTSDFLKESYDFSPFHLEKFPYCELYEPYLAEQSHNLLNYGRLSQEDTETQTRLRTDINKYVGEATVEFISKGVTDATWDAYVAQLNAMGLEEYLALKQKAYDSSKVD